MQVSEHDSHVWTASPTRQAMRILVIEDDREAASWLVKGLAEAGHIADHAADGEEGLGLALEGVHDVLIVDRMLPKIDGLTIIRKLREHNIQTPVLILSALADVDGSAVFATPGGNNVNSILIAPVPVTRDNLSVVVDAGWIPLDVLCQGVPAGSVAPCP